MVAELDDVERLEPGTYDPAEFLPAAYRSVEELEGFLEHLAREIHDPALLRPVERLLLAARSPPTSVAPHAPAPATTPTSAALSSTPSQWGLWSATSASSTRDSTPTCSWQRRSSTTSARPESSPTGHGLS